MIISYFKCATRELIKTNLILVSIDSLFLTYSMRVLAELGRKHTLVLVGCLHSSDSFPLFSLEDWALESVCVHLVKQSRMGADQARRCCALFVPNSLTNYAIVWG